jgi:hypothetical protein
MDLFETWNEHRPKVPSGRYHLKCVKASRTNFWLNGRKGYGRSEKIVLWFEIWMGDFKGTRIPMFMTAGKNGKIPQGSKYFSSWFIANDLRWPVRNRLKEMPVSKFEGKIFEGEIVDVKPRWTTGKELPEPLHYSRVDLIYELFGEVLEEKNT